MAHVEHHRTQTCGRVNLTASIRVSGTRTIHSNVGHGLHTLTITSSSLGLRSDNIFMDTREARPPPLVPLGTLLYGQKGYQTGTRVRASRYMGFANVRASRYGTR